jgi:hypothetical protein
MDKQSNEVLIFLHPPHISGKERSLSNFPPPSMQAFSDNMFFLSEVGGGALTCCVEDRPLGAAERRIGFAIHLLRKQKFVYFCCKKKSSEGVLYNSDFLGLMSLS